MFFYNNNIINIKDKSPIKNIFSSLFPIIDIEFINKNDIKRFHFDGTPQLKTEISINIFETVENLICEYFNKIKKKWGQDITNIKFYFISQGKDIPINEKQLIKDYFIDLIFEEKINIYVHN